ncbi:MAG: tetratricopeptide repeat protein [Glaciecola sp.]
MDERKRKRGIKASRVKLEAAMIKAGLGTQSELAQKIAQQENIAKPPKDLVSKVFREQAVSTHNLTRIANALGVAVHSIYLTRDDSEFSEVVATQSSMGTHDSDNTSNDHNNNNQYNTRASSSLSNKFLWIVLTALIVVLGLWLVDVEELVNNTTNQTQSHAINAPLGKVKIVIQAPLELRQLGQHIADNLTLTNKISATLATTPDSYYLSAYEAIDKWQVHVVIKLHLVKEEYYQLITATAHTQDYQRIVLQDVIGFSELDIKTSQLVEQLGTHLDAFIAGHNNNASMSDSETALALYLRALNELFTSHSANKFKMVLDYLEQALTLVPEFSQAHALSCSTLVRMSWIEEENTLLESAASHCEKAQKLGHNQLRTQLATAELKARTGKIKEAIEILKPYATSNDADSLATMAIVNLAYSKNIDDENANKQVEQLAKRAITINPKHWQAYNTLGNLYFSTGQMNQAKAQFEMASMVVKHEVILANLGTLQLCFGELNKAKQTYLDVIANYENNYLGYEMLGSVYFLQQNYSAALENKLIAIQKHPDVAIHQIWGSVAETYFQLGQIDQAWEHYSKAITLIERDELLENVSFSDQLHKLYYMQKLTLIKPMHAVAPKLSAQLPTFINQRNQLGLKARSHLAWLAGQAQQPDVKDSIWQEISHVCAVYKHSPELMASN